MKYSFDGYNYFVRLEKGDRLLESLEQFVKETKIEGAWINGIGAASEATFGFYDLPAKEYQWKTMSGSLEIASLTGNISFDEENKLVVHLHGVFSYEDFHTVGGHIHDFVVSATAELFIHRSYKPLRRSPDNEIGLKLLDLENDPTPNPHSE